ncbi:MULTISPECIES: zinc-finger-containing protein [Bradyrhizobium]|uniref:zinc-finger-containing protein n=1 Tax=Bradyrhizobium japonicum TaxID=375 RepID=UPI0005A8248E|nr:zinc-finger-containing protein [Bradyrhizobium japonicum]
MTDAPPLCCGVPARLTSGAEIYPRRPDLRTKPIYKCDRCESYCGCHPNTTKSLGVPANAATRRARSQFHDHVFDPIWKTADKTGGYANPDDGRSASKIRKAARSRLYDYLAEKMGLDRKDCHTGMFTVEQCRQATEALRGVTYPMVQTWHQARKQQREQAA